MIFNIGWQMYVWQSILMTICFVYKNTEKRILNNGHSGSSWRIHPFLYLNLKMYLSVSHILHLNMKEEECNDKVSLDNFIDDNTEIDNNPWGYYDLININRSISDVEEDVFSEFYAEDFLYKNVEEK